MSYLQDLAKKWVQKGSDSSQDMNEENNNLGLKTPDWSSWKQRDFIRVWQAAMLSLNIEPNIESRSKLKLDDKLHVLYLSRKRTVLSSNSKLLEIIQNHPAAGANKGDWVLSFQDFCKYAKEKNWPESKAMCENVLKNNRIIRIDDGEISPKAKHSIIKQLEAIFMTFDGFDSDKGRDFNLVVKRLNEMNCSYVADKRTIESWFEKY